MLRVSLAVTAVVGVGYGAAIAAATSVQSYPYKPIRLIAPFPAGGPVDSMARVLAPRLGDVFKQTIVIDNRPGASGSIGIEAGVKAAPDGYTMVIVSGSYAASAAVNKLPYDPVADVAAIVLIGQAPHLAAVHLSVPVANVKELIAFAKSNPGKLNYGSSGTGGSVHLATELFNQMAAIKMTHVPYKGQGPALTDVIAGQIQLLLGSPMTTYPHVKAHRLRALAVTSAQRSGAMPDVPAIAETVPGYEAITWQAILGPRALPHAIVVRWNQAINQILHSAEMRQRLAGDAMELGGGPPERFHEVLARDVAKWRGVVKAAGITAAN